MQHIAHFSNGIVVGHINHRNLHLVEADDAPALLAVEVRVPVVIKMGIVAVAQLVAHALATLYQMHQMTDGATVQDIYTMVEEALK